ncbi:hypothetical protein EDC96DRAFT_436900 [Choanephora cucurbitarum]|nr:hypothetical protein EDC96DRAFT_436900 [Choanephora cucurbitarum]
MGPPSSGASAASTDFFISRLSHYIKCICEDLSLYQMTKRKTKGSVLVFGDKDSDLPLLDFQVTRLFGDKVSQVIRRHQNLDSIDMDQFSRVIKLMENTVIYASDLDVIDYHEKHPEDTDTVYNMLEKINQAFETCSVLFEIITSCKLDKKYVSHELIVNCLHFIKNQLDYTIYPLLDQSDAEDSLSLTSSAYLLHQKIQSSSQKQSVSSMIPHLIRIFRRLLLYISTEALDDDVLVIFAYISMGPFFHDCLCPQQSVLLQQTKNNEEVKFNPYEQLKFYALDILKHLFSKYPKHRRWIFEEILTSLGSLTTMDGTRKYRLKDNQTIHVMSALFMQLVQCSASIDNLTSHKTWYKKWNIKYQKAVKTGDQDEIKLLDDKLLHRASAAWQQSTESATNSASYFLEFLMSK